MVMLCHRYRRHSQQHRINLLQLDESVLAAQTQEISVKGPPEKLNNVLAHREDPLEKAKKRKRARLNSQLGVDLLCQGNRS